VRRALFIGLTVFAVVLVFAFVVSSANATGNTLRFFEGNPFIQDSTKIDSPKAKADSANVKVDSTNAVDTAKVKKYEVKDSTNVKVDSTNACRYCNG